MKRDRKFIIGIVAGLVLVISLVCAAIWVAFVRAPYHWGDNAETVAYNYHIALIRENYKRAYGYLSPSLANYPASVDIFIQDLVHFDELPRLKENPCVHIESSTVSGDRATVRLMKQDYDPCSYYFGNIILNLTRNPFKVELRLEEGVWKIVESKRYFARCWTSLAGCQ